LPAILAWGEDIFSFLLEPIRSQQRPKHILMNRQDRLNDELLVLRCQEGDAEAFELLVGRWQQRLWRHAWRLTGDESAAWDVIQETWIGISRGISRLTDAAAFHAWAYQIVSNKCRDSIRRQRRRREASETYSERMQREERQSAFTKEQHGNLKEALDQLSGPDRAVLSLRYEEYFDTADIAGILGIPEGTVKSRLFYARGRLRKYLENNDE
jgi:RNA polymerase sigma-70 factor, ECF subfamily